MCLTGSEPSLVNHTASSSASKRTLTSRDAPNGSTDSLDVEPRSPSYVKLSCAVSGYTSNRYRSPSLDRANKPPLPHKPVPLRAVPSEDARTCNGVEASAVTVSVVTVFVVVV